MLRVFWVELELRRPGPARDSPAVTPGAPGRKARARDFHLARGPNAGPHGECRRPNRPSSARFQSRCIDVSASRCDDAAMASRIRAPTSRHIGSAAAQARRRSEDQQPSVRSGGGRLRFPHRTVWDALPVLSKLSGRFPLDPTILQDAFERYADLVRTRNTCNVLDGAPCRKRVLP